MKGTEERGVAIFARHDRQLVLFLKRLHQSGSWWHTLVPFLNRELLSGSDSDDNVDDALMDALAECYNNANLCDTRRQTDVVDNGRQSNLPQAGKSWNILSVCAAST